MPDLPRQLAAIERSALVLRTADDPEVRSVGEGLVEWLAGGAAAPLERVLGVRSVGGLSPRQALVLAERDRMICHLHRLLWSGLHPAAAVREMTVSYEGYVARRWPRDRDAGEPAAEPAATWWRLLSSGAAFPRRERLRQIIRGASPNPVRPLNWLNGGGHYPPEGEADE